MIAWTFLCSLLAGCGADMNTLGLTQKQIENREAFQSVPASQAWVNPEGITVIMQRGLLAGAEQRIGLRSTVPVPGDNILVLRTRSGHLAAGRFRFEEFMTRVGGAPAPFGDLSSGELHTSEDAIGTYFWAEESMGTNVTCVFAIRRLTESDRRLPLDSRVMDVMLRNCAVGDAADALTPILDESIGVGATAGVTGGGDTRMLSPLAAPGMGWD